MDINIVRREVKTPSPPPFEKQSPPILGNPPPIPENSRNHLPLPPPTFKVEFSSDLKFYS